MPEDPFLQSAVELFIDALQCDYADLWLKHEGAVGQLVFYKELCSIAMARMYAAEEERDKLRKRVRELMGVDSDQDRQQQDNDEG